MAEGKSRESAEKIVGSFVHKVEASSGSGGAGIGGANMTNGGTLTTQTGGANNPLYNKKKPKSADISNTGSGGTTEGAFNQDAPNAQRLNNKSDDEEDPDYQTDKKEFEREEAKIKKPFTDDAITARQYNKADDEEDEEVPAPQEEEERPEWDWLMNRHKAKATREVNKVHALMKLNNIRKIKRNPTAPKSTQNSMTNDVNNYNNWSRLQAGVQGHRDVDSQEYARRLQINAVRAGRGMTDKYPMPPRTGLKQTKRTVGASRASLGGGSGKGDGALGKSSGTDGKQTRPISRNPSRNDAKKPHDKDSKDDDHESPPTPKIRYSRGGDSAARQLKMSLNELIKKLPKKISDESEYNNPKWKSPDELPLDELDHTDVHGLGERGNSRLGNTDEVLGDSIVQNTSSHGDVQSNVGRKIRERGHGHHSGIQATMSRRNANIMRSNIEKALDELKKLSTFKAPPEKTRKRITVESIIAENKKEREDAEKRVRAQKINALEKALDELNKLTSKEHESHNSDSGGFLGEDDTVEEIKYPSRNIPKRIQERHANEMQNYLNNPNQNYYSNMRYGKRGTKTSRKLEKALDELNKKKAMTYRKTRGNVEMKYPTVGEEVWDSKQQKRVKETKTPKRTMALEKALAELKKLQISGGLGSRGLGSDHGHTQGSGDSTQVTLVQPRPEDDRVSSKRTTKEPKE